MPHPVKVIELPVGPHGEARCVNDVLRDRAVTARKQGMPLATVQIVGLIVVGLIDHAGNFLGERTEDDVPVAV